MNTKFLLIISLTIILSCKASKERKACFELTAKNQKLAIEDFDDLKEYTGVYWVKLLSAVWILEGEVISDSEMEKRMDEEEFDILKVQVLDDDSLQVMCRTVSTYVLISTNSCLKKY